MQRVDYVPSPSIRWTASNIEVLSIPHRFKRPGRKPDKTAIAVLVVSFLVFMASL